eukprot:COSAG06_NODE_63794_length_261_cov_0.802469_1_plen_76_part_01
MLRNARLSISHRILVQGRQLPLRPCIFIAMTLRDAISYMRPYGLGTLVEYGALVKAPEPYRSCTARWRRRRRCCVV